MMHRRLCHTAHVDKVLRIININRITFRNYTWAWFEHLHVVYVRASSLSKHLYIGRTHVGMGNRELSRMRKFHQLRNDKLIQAEVALRYWHKHENFHSFCPIVVRHGNSRKQTEDLEQVMISEWQPSLNPPFIFSHFKMDTAAQGAAIRAHTTFKRLWRKVRKRYRKQLPKLMNSGLLDRGQAMEVIMDLGRHNMCSFEAAKFLRSSSCTVDQCYALHKMASTLEEPSRTAICATIGRCLKWRNQSLPKSASAFKYLFLAHPHWPTLVKQWISTICESTSLHSIPFHPASHKIVEVNHPSLADLLHSWKQWMTTFTISPPDHSRCQCASILEKHPSWPSIDGLVLGAAAEMNDLPSNWITILSSSSKDTVMPSKSTYIEKSSLLVKSWSILHGLPPMVTVASWQQFVSQHWSEHQTHSHKYHSANDVKKIRQLLSGLVVHCEDHCPRKLCVFCPDKYRAMIHKLLSDGKIFQELPISATQLRSEQFSRLPKVIKSKYKWGVSLRKQPAYTYIFPKRKKQWTTSRPIVSFFKCFASNILNALGNLIYDLTINTYVDTYAVNNVSKAMQHISRFLHVHHQHMEMKNDDLVGFFTSIPHWRIMKAAEQLIVDHQHRNPQVDVWDKCYTVSLHPHVHCGRTVQGRTNRLLRSRKIMLRHVPELVLFALQQSDFTCLGKAYKQIQGATIGGPASPALCNLVVHLDERMWRQAWNVMTHSHTLILRYVDNRLIIAQPLDLHKPAMREFCSLDFYRYPVELEEVGDNHFLGFNIDLDKREIRYMMPTESWQFKSIHSANGMSYNLASLQSRLYIIMRGASPHLRKEQCRHLADVYIKLGFDKVAVDLITCAVIRKGRKFSSRT
jgi:hypothetical protein